MSVLVRKSDDPFLLVGGCTFCEPTKVSELYEIKSTSPNRTTTIRLCSACLAGLRSQTRESDPSTQEPGATEPPDAAAPVVKSEPTLAIIERARRLQALAMNKGAAANERENAWQAFEKLWKTYNLPPNLGL